MDTPIETQAQPACKYPQASTKHIVVTGRYAALLEEDFGLEWGVVLECLVGEPCKTGMALCEWATTKREPAKALVAWARKNKRGTYRPNTNAPAPGHTTTAPPTKEVGSESLRGAVPVAMAMAGLERMKG